MEIYLPFGGNERTDFGKLESEMNRYFASNSGGGEISILAKTKKELRDLISQVQPCFDYTLLGVGRKEDYLLIKVGANI